MISAALLNSLYMEADNIYGIGLAVDPYSKLATEILNTLLPLIGTCSMPDCNNPAVRVGVFETTKDNVSDFRGLCERHKQFGIWKEGWNLLDE